MENLVAFPMKHNKLFMKIHGGGLTPISVRGGLVNRRHFSTCHFKQISAINDDATAIFDDLAIFPPLQLLGQKRQNR